MQKFESSQTTIGKFFDNKDIIFRVPLYQREYSWTEENIDSLLEDLFSGESYFLGAFVLNNEYLKKEKTKDIVDGQQRILTLTIFFAVLRDLFLELKDKTRSGKIQEGYISNKDDDGKDHFKTIASNSVKVFFEEYIQKENTKIDEAPVNTKEEDLVVNNYKKIRNVITEKLKKYSDNYKKIDELVEIRESIKRLEVIVIEVNSEDDAFTFFETLNARSMELSQADLIKNLIFKNINKENKEIQLEWDKIKDNLNNNSETVDINQFIRHFWLSTKAKVREKELFKVIKKDNGDYNKLLEALVLESEFYRMIINPSSNDWENKDLNIFKALKRISALNVKQIRSLLLTLIRLIKDTKYWENNSTKLVYETIYLLENFTFIFTSIVGKSPAPLEGIYSKYSIRLNDQYKKRNKHSKPEIEKILKELKKELLSKCPTENEFKDNFIKIEYKKSSKQISFIKYILEKINYNGSDEEKFDHITLEHILPQSPYQYWGLTEETVSDYVNKIGNIIPLGKEYNEDASNFELQRKITMYEKSNLRSVKKIVIELKNKKLNWGLKQIELRSIKLADEAWSIWNIK